LPEDLTTMPARIDRKRRYLSATLAAITAGVSLASQSVCAQTNPAAWPVRPVRIIVPFPAGGSTMEQVVRQLITAMPASLGHPVLIDNRPGAGTVIGVDAGARATDGHTFVGVANSFTVNASLVRQLPYDTLRDLRPVILLARTPNLLAVRRGLAASSVAELVAMAKAQPGKLSYASFGNGTTAHFAGEMFKSAAGVDIVHVPYKGQGPALTDLLAGNVDLMFGNLTDMLPHVRGGRLTGLATTFLQRVPQAPEMPTVAEQGYPGFETDSWYGIMAPASASGAMVARMNAEFSRALEDAGTRRAMAAQGLAVLGGTPEQFGEHLRREIARYEQVVRQAHMTID
jgi:tripartite-type tricarboxylate transporter receptor subunit TctC